MGLTYHEFKLAAAELAGIDLSAYKSQQMDRRLHSLMHAWGVADYDRYLALLRKNPDKLREFHKRLTINVSEFFRNPDRFTELASGILPELYRKGGRLRFWSAGCSNGAEAYTLAILIAEASYQPGAEIIGTDIDRESLHRAEVAFYIPNEVKNVPGDLLYKYFINTGRGYRLAPEIKGMVRFKHGNLLADGAEYGCDLVLCRNVVIYLTEEAKDYLYGVLLRALNPGGYLMVGGTEPLLNFRDLGLENPVSVFYRRKADPPPPGKARR